MCISRALCSRCSTLSHSGDPESRPSLSWGIHYKAFKSSTGTWLHRRRVAVSKSKTSNLKVPMPAIQADMIGARRRYLWYTVSSASNRWPDASGYRLKKAARVCDAPSYRFVSGRARQTYCMQNDIFSSSLPVSAHVSL